jgi:hypothetical protein
MRSPRGRGKPRPLSFEGVKPEPRSADAYPVTLSPPVRIVGLAGLLLALAGAAALEYPKLTHRVASPLAPARTVPVTTPAPAPAARAPAPAKPIELPGVPPAVSAALRRHATVVAFVYSPSSPGDIALLAQVRAGARDAHAAFVPLDVERDAVAVDVYAWTKKPADPEVLVVKRPGRVAFAIEGATDRTAVAQATATAP